MRLGVAIQSLHRFGGQERSNLEIISRLSQTFPVDVFAYRVQTELEIQPPLLAKVIRIPFEVRRPAVLRNFIFHVFSLISLRMRSDLLVQATGTCSLLSQVVQVQFLHSAWQEVLRRHSGITEPRGWLRGFYHAILVRYESWLERKVFRKDKTYIAISHSVARDLVRLFGGTDVHVIHHGVDSQRFSPISGEAEQARAARIRSEWGVTQGQVVFLFVGVLERKGLEVALRSFALLSSEQRARSRLVAIGAGDHKRFVALSEELGIRSQFTLMGPRRDIAECFQAADVFLFPTFYEPFGMVILEAMATGLPVITTREAGASELIEDGVSGLLVSDPSRVEEIRLHMARMIDEPSARARIGTRARIIAERRSWDVVAREYSKILEPLLQRSP